jgi:hypothetical protein
MTTCDEKDSQSASPKQRSPIRWIFPSAGLLALAWFLIRVIPKPSRATYPCQRAAFPLASAFVVYLISLFGMAAAVRKARQTLSQSKYAAAGLLLALAVVCGVAMSDFESFRASADFIPTDPPNSPVGEGKGINPGRVAWDWNPDATNWSPAWNERTDIFYWDDAHTSQAAVDEMVSNTLQWLTGRKSDAAAWDSLFRHFNQANGKGYAGYTPGEKILIKPNHVEQRSHDDRDNLADLSPQMIIALLKQLVENAGIPQADITVSDPSRYIADKVYDPCHALYPDVVFAESTFYRPENNPGTAGRVSAANSTEHQVHYSGPDAGDQPIASTFIPVVCVETDYIINLAIMKGHSTAGVTLSAKNWYGCLGQRPTDGHHSRLPADAPEMNQYRPMVDLMGHELLGGKTILYVLDGLWGFQFHGAGSTPVKWQNAPFNDDYPSCVLMSQDPVALDSVGTDFLRAEFSANMGGKNLVDGGVDDYLHEAAQAHSPPSGTEYDPEDDGTPLASLGVHEHWNNPLDKQYTRNLGTGEGIELVDEPILTRSSGGWEYYP